MTLEMTARCLDRGDGTGGVDVDAGGDGLSAWTSARIRWRQDMGGSESASVSAALAKADMQAARIALVLAESMHPGEGGDTMPEDAVAAAVAITDYVIGCWRAMPDREALTTSRRDETLHRGVGQLADWLEQHGGLASRSQLRQACVARARTAADLDALLARYEAEYPGSVREGERIGTRGPSTATVCGANNSAANGYPPTVSITGSDDSSDSCPHGARIRHPNPDS